MGFLKDILKVTPDMKPDCNSFQFLGISLVHLGCNCVDDVAVQSTASMQLKAERASDAHQT